MFQKVFLVVVVCLHGVLVSASGLSLVGGSRNCSPVAVHVLLFAVALCQRTWASGNSSVKGEALALGACAQ